MGFFDEFEDTSGLAFVGEDEKKVLIAEQVVFPVQKLQYQEESKYGPRYLLTTTLDGEERVLSFGAKVVESRDRMFDAMIAYFEREDEAAEQPAVRLEKVGRSILVRDALAV